jgi:hypothetical protein
MRIDVHIALFRDELHGALDLRMNLVTAAFILGLPSTTYRGPDSAYIGDHLDGLACT